MNRRAFIGGGISVVAFTPAFAAQDRAVFVCPPCGCASDGATFESRGFCPSCGMRLADKAALDELEGIPNFLKLEDLVWTAGQPTMDHFTKLQREGVKTVINLRAPQESGNTGLLEESKLKDLGIEYFNIPVVFGALAESAVDEFLRVTDERLDQGERFLIHCQAAVRVGAFWMIRRVVRDGWTFERALEEANRIGLGNNRQLIEFARRYIDKHTR